jgi:protein-S-isoprenylcysteine O-methyltransferase Ste14
VLGAVVVWLGCREEDKYLVKKFGKGYKTYMKRVPQMNFLLGIVRLLRNRG